MAVDTEFKHEKWNLYTAKICQIAAVTENGQFNTYVNCGSLTSAPPTQMRPPGGLTGNFLEDKLDQKAIDNGSSVCQGLKEFLQFMHKESPTDIIGHSPVGDMKLLSINASKCGLKFPVNIKDSSDNKIRVMDTYDMCQIKFPKGKCSLGNFYKMTFPDRNEDEQAHNSLADANMTYQVFREHEDIVSDLFVFLI